MSNVVPIAPLQAAKRARADREHEAMREQCRCWGIDPDILDLEFEVETDANGKTVSIELAEPR